MGEVRIKGGREGAREAPSHPAHSLLLWVQALHCRGKAAGSGEGAEVEAGRYVAL